ELYRRSPFAGIPCPCSKNFKTTNSKGKLFLPGGFGGFSGMVCVGGGGVRSCPEGPEGSAGGVLPPVFVGGGRLPGPPRLHRSCRSLISSSISLRFLRILARMALCRAIELTSTTCTPGTG